MSVVKPEGKVEKKNYFPVCNIINSPAGSISLQYWACYSQQLNSVCNINVLRVTKLFFLSSSLLLIIFFIFVVWSLTG